VDVEVFRLRQVVLHLQHLDAPPRPNRKMGQAAAVVGLQGIGLGLPGHGQELQQIRPLHPIWHSHSPAATIPPLFQTTTRNHSG
jgi:hypothetical protein